MKLHLIIGGKENGSIPYNTVGGSTSNLTFIDAQTEDSGNYRCVVTNECNVTSYSEYTAITIIEGNFIRYS